MKLQVLAGFLTCSGALAQSTSVLPPPPASPTSHATPALPSGALTAQAGLLGPPRVHSAGGTTRFVLDLPDDALYTVTPIPTGLRIDLSNVSTPARQADSATPELKAWSVTPTASGAAVDVISTFPLGPDNGWRSFELPKSAAQPRRLVIDLSLPLQGAASGGQAGTDHTAPPPASVPTLPPPATPGPDMNAAVLPVPRFGKTPGSSRIVLEFPEFVTYAITPGPLGLRIDLTGIRADEQAGQQVSPELAEWRFEPTTSGVSVTLRTTYPIQGRGGWKSILLPPVEGSALQRLAIDLAPALADTTPLPIREAALPPFPLPARIVLDPGHGGKDPGAVGSIMEKIVTLDVALRTRALLQAAGAQVTLTRDRDVHLAPTKETDLGQRAAFGTSPNQVYVSIHVNAMEKSAVMRGYGVETWWYPNDPGSNVLAAHLQSNVIRFTGAYSQGLKSTSLAVLRQARIPAALVEIGYTTHPVDGQNLLSSHYLDRVAAGIAWGVRSYLAPITEGQRPATGE